MPNPEKGESEREFLKRCIPYLAHEGYDNPKQRSAICYAKYRKTGTQAKSLPPAKKSYKTLTKKRESSSLFSSLLSYY